ncbi:MAG: cytidylate kinase-like family protein [Prevotellaceae bacterium]|nr:cytidylate kinase-like family protein [Prevotellaceae bacterium]
MDTNKKFLITINREYGSGGHAIGSLLAQRLGVKLIDKQLLKAVAEKFGISELDAERLENKRPSWWEDFAMFYKRFISVNPYEEGTQAEITSRQLFYAQASAMREIVAKESCVIIGRCAFDIFKDEPNSLRLFVYAPMEKRVERIVSRYHCSDAEARQRIADSDYQRQLYTKTFTGKEVFDARNYDLTLNVGNTGVNGAVEFLIKNL